MKFLIVYEETTFTSSRIPPIKNTLNTVISRDTPITELSDIRDIEAGILEKGDKTYTRYINISNIQQLPIGEE